jgi:3-hydroxyisobutyrate dehydrogenase-like beta-hydroxyacid dehydrogenase
MEIAFLGTGLMGAPMARRLAAAGHAVRAWNRTATKARALEGPGIAVAGTAEEACAGAGAVVTMLTDGRALGEVLGRPGLRLPLEGRTLVQMSTIAPEESREAAQRVAAAGGRYLEAPVLGSIPQAEAAELRIMVGGDADLYGELEPALAAMGRPRHVGAVGQAAALKLAFNHLIGAQTAAFALSLGLVRRAGLDREDFLEILRASPLHAATFEVKLDSMVRRDFAAARFPAKHLLKDLRLVEQTSSALGLRTPVVEALVGVLEATVAHGHAEHDYASLYEEIDPA